MGIPQRHIELHREVLNLPGLVAEPFLMVGLSRIRGKDLPADFDYPDLRELLRARGLTDVVAVDYFDPSADLRYDLNAPVPEHEHDRYQTVYDIGTIEHVFDTRQCLENCVRMVKVGGHYFIHTPVKGYFRHGLHTFDPEILVQAMEINNFEIVYKQFSSRAGERLERPGEAANALLWVAGRKTAPIDEFQVPQQDWSARYERQSEGAG